MTSFFDDDVEKSVASLIEVGPDGYRVNEDTMKWISNFEHPFGVLSCAGKYRTGKSFLLNRMADAPSGCGFGVGETVQACTKGIWVYKKFLPSERNDGTYVLIMDTEGIDALDASDTHDVRIFTMALLLSSSFIYNSVGTIDEASMQTLSLMTRVTENVKITAENNCTSSELGDHMPTFYWILRDFSLKLVDKDGTPMSEEQYLNNALTTSDTSKSTVREAIRNSFPSRRLVTLPRPSNLDDTGIQTLEHKLFNLNKKFANALKDLRSRIFREIVPFRIDKTTVTGGMYCELCRYLVTAIQSEAVPVIKDSWTLMAAVHGRDLKDTLIKEMMQVTSSMKPKPESIMESELYSLSTALITRFEKDAMKPIDDDCVQTLKQELKSISDDTFERLAKNIQHAIEERLDEIHTQVKINPFELVKPIKDAQYAFAKECQEDFEFMKLWRSMLSERLMTDWIPQILKLANQTKNDLDASIENHEASMKHQKDALNDEMEAFKKTHSMELNQKMEELESLKAQLESLQNLYQEAEVNLSQNTIKQKELSDMLDDKNEQIDRMHDLNTSSQSEKEGQLLNEIEQKCLEFRQAQIEIEDFKRREEELSSNCQNLELELEQTKQRHKMLESQWSKGLEEVREEAMETEQMLRLETEKIVKEEKANTEKVTRVKDDLKAQCEDLEKTNEEQTRQLESNKERYLSENKRLENLVDTYKEQSEEAQKRVLEIHKEMLSDMRSRDEKARQQQIKDAKEQNEFQSKYLEAVRSNELKNNENRDLKRRLSEIEEMTNDHKKMKLQHQEMELTLARLESEKKQLESHSEQFRKERDNLRKENLAMEGELAVLRSEKKLFETRKSLIRNGSINGS